MKVTIPTVAPWRMAVGRLSAARHALLAIAVALSSAGYLLAVQAADAAGPVTDSPLLAWLIVRLA